MTRQVAGATTEGKQLALDYMACRTDADARFILKAKNIISVYSVSCKIVIWWHALTLS